MNVLLFDGGNSRFKWALVRNGRLDNQRAAARDDFDPFTAWLARAPAIDRVVGVNVGGAAVERALRRALRSAGQPRPELIQSSAEAAGVRNAYARPEQLGADRWAAAIAAWHAAGCYRTVCAVSIGTALTLDLVDQDGHHRGGLISPGPRLMREALLGRTADIAPRAAQAAARTRPRARSARALVPPLAGATLAAVEEGCLAACAGFIDRTVTQLTRRLNVRPVLYITGGASEAVIERLRSACKPSDDLVLRGVAAIAEVNIRRRA
jgi:type III pantothenate kinase